MHFDLHMHSVNSHDGFYSEKELIAGIKIPMEAVLAGLIVLVLIVEWISTKIRVKLARG